MTVGKQIRQWYFMDCPRTCTTVDICISSTTGLTQYRQYTQYTNIKYIGINVSGYHWLQLDNIFQEVHVLTGSERKVLEVNAI